MSDARILPTPRPQTFSRATRRVLVTVTYLGYAFFVWAFWAARTLDVALWTILLAAVPALATMLCYVALYAYTRSIADRSDRQLDERERMVRDRAYRLAYQVVATVLLLLIFYAMVAIDGGDLWFPRTLNQFSAIFWGAMLLTTSLPTAMIAWTEPDEVDDEG